jgi:hypothetical protein
LPGFLKRLLGKYADFVVVSILIRLTGRFDIGGVVASAENEKGS